MLNESQITRWSNGCCIVSMSMFVSEANTSSASFPVTRGSWGTTGAVIKVNKYMETHKSSADLE